MKDRTNITPPSFSEARSRLLYLAAQVDAVTPLRVLYAAARAAARFQGEPPPALDAAEVKSCAASLRSTVREALESDPTHLRSIRDFYASRLAEARRCWPELDAECSRAELDRWAETPCGSAIADLLGEASYLESLGWGSLAGVLTCAERSLEDEGTPGGVCAALRRELDRLEKDYGGSRYALLARQAELGSSRARAELQGLREEAARCRQEQIDRKNRS